MLFQLELDFNDNMFYQLLVSPFTIQVLHCANTSSKLFFHFSDWYFHIQDAINYSVTTNYDGDDFQRCLHY